MPSFVLLNQNTTYTTCKRCFSAKKPKMPVQAVANGLELSPIPEELSNLNDLER